MVTNELLNLDRGNYTTDILCQVLDLALETKEENEIWDFKEKCSNKYNDILNDIVSFSNTTHMNNCFIFYGISNDFKVVGLKNPEDFVIEGNLTNIFTKAIFIDGDKPDYEIICFEYNHCKLQAIVIYNTLKTPIIYGMRSDNVNIPIRINSTTDRNNPKDRLIALCNKRSAHDFSHEDTPTKIIENTIKDKKWEYCDNEHKIISTNPRVAIDITKFNEEKDELELDKNDLAKVFYEPYLYLKKINILFDKYIAAQYTALMTHVAYIIMYPNLYRQHGIEFYYYLNDYNKCQKYSIQKILNDTYNVKINTERLDEMIPVLDEEPNFSKEESTKLLEEAKEMFPDLELTSDVMTHFIREKFGK